MTSLKSIVCLLPQCRRTFQLSNASPLALLYQNNGESFIEWIFISRLLMIWKLLSPQRESEISTWLPRHAPHFQGVRLEPPRSLWVPLSQNIEINFNRHDISILLDIFSKGMEMEPCFRCVAVPFGRIAGFDKSVYAIGSQSTFSTVSRISCQAYQLASWFWLAINEIL
jgi:hypothetical protein